MLFTISFEEERIQNRHYVTGPVRNLTGLVRIGRPRMDASRSCKPLTALMATLGLTGAYVDKSGKAVEKRIMSQNT